MNDDRSIEALRQSYLLLTGGELSLMYPSFHGWFVASLTTLLREVLDSALEDLPCYTDRFDSRLARFRDVLVPEMTVVTLYRSLTDSFPGSGDEQSRRGGIVDFDSADLAGVSRVLLNLLREIVDRSGFLPPSRGALYERAGQASWMSAVRHTP